MAVAAAMTLLAAGCAAGKDSRVSVEPAAQTLMPDSTGAVTLRATVAMPEKYLSRRSRLVISPQLVSADTLVRELRPAALYSHIYAMKKRRRRVLHGETDPYAPYAVPVLPRNDSIRVTLGRRAELPANMGDHARLVAFVTVDGCNTCENADTLVLAEICNPATLLDLSPRVEWQDPAFVVRPKVAQGKGEARLQFVINKSDIRLDMGNNRAELDSMESRLRPIITDTLATLNSLTIFGMASADGSYAFNTNLARNRASAARDWLVSHLGMTPAQQRAIRIGSKPEGWLPVLRAMTADGHPDSAAVRAIIDANPGINDDPQERLIRRLRCWPDIRDRYLQKDRKVEYSYTYTLRNFTSDAELLDMYAKRPDAFNEDELLRVATLMPDTAAKRQVYETLLRYFPQSAAAAGNLAVLALRDGDTERAMRLLGTPDAASPHMSNAMAAICIGRGDYDGAEQALLRADTLPEARYNRAIVKAARRQYGQALNLMRPFADTNCAVLALCTGRDSEAYDIMSRCGDRSPRAEYVRAMAAARLGLTDEARAHLDAAKADPALASRAEREPDLRPLRAAKAQERPDATTPTIYY